MGTIEIDKASGVVLVSSAIIGYGDAADMEITRYMAEEIETMWNEPQGKLLLRDRWFTVQFRISAQYNSWIVPKSIAENQNPRNNYIRIEDYSIRNISCMDAIGSNTGYFQRNNLYGGSTTAAHEYGHSLGLPHPGDLNFVGKGRPGIMYPRGTLVDPEFQNDVTAIAGGPGGTLNPRHRKVMQADIDHLQLDKLIDREIFVIGKFTNVYHERQVQSDNG